MKKLFLSLCAAVVSMAAMAQDDLVATLSHDGSIAGTYYGEDALVSAYDNALEGDVITLSAGTFNCPSTIEKAIVIRGVGMETATEKVNVTKLSGTFTWTVPENPAITPLLEGVYVGNITFQGSNINSKANISKCNFNQFSFKNGTFSMLHCIRYSTSDYDSSIDLRNQEETFVYIKNCVTGKFSILYNNRAIVENSIIKTPDYGFRNTTVINSILIGCSNIDATNIIRYCVASPYSSNYPGVFNNLGAESSNNTEVDGISQIIQDFYNSTKPDYHLTESAAATYLGNDGTEVGIYGGANPFNPIPTNPRVRKLVVDTTPGSNGKLNVTIEVE